MSMEPSFNEIIHAERSKLLSELPKGARAFCSAGCAGSWYFKWIEDCYGKVNLHYGVELFSPKPDDLPPNVVWIQNSVSNMVDVPSSSVDLLFSGQNIEHLYRDDLIGFLSEAQRVVKPGGYLCIDSPNRLVSAEYGYTQPQHVLELSKKEILELLRASGFSIQTVKGIWSCKTNDDHVSDLTAVTPDWRNRAASGSDNPDDSFIWWVVAKRSDVSEGSVRQIADDIASTRFPGFVRSRFRHGVGSLTEFEGTEVVIQLRPQDVGYVFFGPYVPLRQGKYAVTFMVRFLAGGGSLRADVVSGGGVVVHCEQIIQAGELASWHAHTLMVDMSDYVEGVETRLYTEGASAEVLLGTQIYRI